MNSKTHRIIISGGGTGGHIYPAISIANAIKAQAPDAEILFVGALGKMEMEKVPAEGYAIKGLPIAGLQRSLSAGNIVKNLLLPIKILESVREAGKILNDFKPTLAVGVGGYASGPLLWAARSKGIPYALQEQNSFAGKTNQILAKGATKIFTAYPRMERFFPADKIIMTGNPIRSSMAPATEALKAEAQAYFHLDKTKKTLLIMGGSLGARTFNHCMEAYLDQATEEVQIIWQCGRQGLKSGTEKMKDYKGKAIQLHAFISRMDYAYAAADAVVSRAGAGSISELSACAKACLFVPSPNVAEDHQRHNALSLVERQAALMILDIDAAETLMSEALKLVQDKEQTNSLSNNIYKLARPNAAADIATMLLSL